MIEPTPPTLRSLLEALHAERERTWPPAQLEANIEQRRYLEATADRDRFIKLGDHVADFRLAEVGGGEVALRSLLGQGPVVLVFFRFAGCPACNIALPYYQAHLRPQLRTLGAELVALSPQIPERLAAIKARHGLDFPVLTDAESFLAETFGIAFEPDAQSLARAKAAGRGAVRETTGASNDAFPMPAVIVVDRDGRVVFADVTPDWLARTEPSPVLEAVAALQAVSLELAS